MNRNKWYLSTWFIAVLFAFWFLIIPLVLGFYLIRLQKDINIAKQAYIDLKEKEIQRHKNELDSQKKELEGMKLHKQKEIEELETAHEEKLVLMTSDREKMLQIKENEIELKEKDIDRKTVEKQKEIKELEAILYKKLVLVTKKRENDLILMEQENESKEKKIQQNLEGKQKELIELELAHQRNLILMTKERDEELESREKAIEKSEKEFNELNEKRLKAVSDLDLKIKIATQKKNILQSQIINLKDELLYQSFGFYETKFDLENSDEYKYHLEVVRSEQKKLAKEKLAAIITIFPDSIAIVQGDNPIKNKNIKLAIRSFNNECDSVISKVKFNNVEMSEKKIRSSFHLINELNQHNFIEISEEYLSLKLEELFLAYEYSQKKQEEKEEQSRINEQIREERKAQQELEEELKILRKEEQHIENAMKHSSQFSEERVHELKTRLEEIKRQKEEVDYRVKNAKAGYIYVISNIGSFGENVYKIGMTRRLDPMERVRELGGASVPFRYDVHAVIFSDNAPELEASLHRRFSHRRVNKINERKEFFNVRLEEIKKVVNHNHSAVIEFTMVADAKEYRETKNLEEKISESHIV